MSLKCGIVGLANCGKTTIFNCMSTARAQTSNYAFSSNKSNIATVTVPDERLFVLEQLVRAAKVVHASVEIVDIPGLTKGSSKGEGVGNTFLADIQQTDALIHVVRCFDDAGLPHIEGSVNPVRDMEIVELELQIRDLDLVERKLVRTEKAAKSGDKEMVRHAEILKRYKEHLENFSSARNLDVSEEDKKAVSDLGLLTAKPVIYVCNVDESSAAGGNDYVTKFREAVSTQNTEVLVIAGRLESEIAELEDISDRLAFLQEVGLSEPGVNKLIRSAYHLLNLRTFFTAGPKEARAWTIRKGMTAPQAAGVIHSDLERGFIRAEVMKYEDFATLKSEQACKEAGKLTIEGKNYVVGEGDILHIRFNV
jgi:ribosome-binding ATPase